MRGFFKIFFASFFALVVFCVIGLLIMIAVVNGLSSKNKPKVEDKSILVLDLSQHFKDKADIDPVTEVVNNEGNVPPLYDVIRLINTAKNDDHISGIYILANNNANSFASSNELRNALLQFKKSKKFIVAYGDVMSQGAYFIANTADKVYVNGSGDIEWKGFNVDFLFLKGMLDRLKIQPQIFYAGKYKSATEIFRTTQMTPENKIQTTAWLGDLYNYFLVKSAEARKIDTATLHRYANNGTIQSPADALKYKLIDGLKYDDEVKDEFRKRLKVGKWDDMNFIALGTYAEASNFKQTGKDKIAVIYAEGDIVDGDGTTSNIGGDNYRKLIRKIRLDASVKAIVLRVNSGGGSALASDKIWRELEMAKKDKPVVVSFGDVAASGGYYIACGADSIFTSPNTITGSIGVFTLIPNMKDFFNDKLGVTFDGVKTADYADEGAVYRPLNEREKEFIQQDVDKIYFQFKQRVVKGRNKSITYIDSIAQGRVWSGEDAIEIGLADKIGGLQQAIDCAARLAKTNNYRIRNYPEPQNWIERIINKSEKEPMVQIQKELGEENFRVFQQVLNIKHLSNSVQARLPFEFFIR